MQSHLEEQAQTEWKWYIALYLFIAGVGAGAYLTGVVASYLGTAWEPVAWTGIMLGFPLLAAGTLFLLMDLGVKWRALRIFFNPGTSWIARGGLIISVFMILSFLHLVLLYWPEPMRLDDPVLRAIGVINVLCSVLVMVYTGALLSASRAIAFWNTAMLPALFLVSATSTGIMAVMLLADAEPGPLLALAKVDLLALVLECVLVFFYVQSSHRTDEARASASLLVRGRLATTFWLGLVGLGLLVPIGLELLVIAIESYGPSELTFFMRAGAVAGLIGGLLLRRLVLAAGIRAPLRAAGIEFHFPSSIGR